MIIEKDNPNLPFISPFLHIIHNLYYGNFSDAVKGYIAHKFDVQRISEVIGLIKDLEEELYLFRHKEFNRFFDNYFDINTIEEIFDLRREVTIDLIEEVVYSIKFLSLIQTAERDKTTVLLEQQYQRITGVTEEKHKEQIKNFNNASHVVTPEVLKQRQFKTFVSNFKKGFIERSGIAEKDLIIVKFTDSFNNTRVGYKLGEKVFWLSYFRGIKEVQENISLVFSSKAEHTELISYLQSVFDEFGSDIDNTAYVPISSVTGTLGNKKFVATTDSIDNTTEKDVQIFPKSVTDTLKELSCSRVQNPVLRLFVWEDVLFNPNYGNGIMFAYAENEDEARKLLRENLNSADIEKPCKEIIKNYCSFFQY